MLGNDALEFLKRLYKLDDIWKDDGKAEYSERQLVQFAKRYHEHKCDEQKTRDHIDSVLPDEMCEWIRQKYEGEGDDIFLTNCGEKETWERRKESEPINNIDKFCRYCGKKTKLSFA